MSYFGATGTPVLDLWWLLLWVSKPEWVLPYSHCRGKCNVHPLRSTSVLHTANLSTDSIVGCWQGSYLVQGYYCVAPVRLEPAIIRLRVLRTNHSATPPCLTWLTVDKDGNGADVVELEYLLELIERIDLYQNKLSTTSKIRDYHP